MSFFSPESEENAAQFALVLVAQQELLSLESNSSESLLDDVKYALKPFCEVFLQRIADHYVQKDQQLLPTTYLTRSLIHNLGPVLLGPDPKKDYAVPNRETTEEILETIHDNDGVTSVGSPELAHQLSKILVSSLLLVGPQKPDFTTVVYEFVVDATSKYSQFISGDTLPIQVTAITEFLHRKTSDVLQLSYVYPVFKQTLSTHVDLVLGSTGRLTYTSTAVLKLREQGNNLMLSLGYAQAIQLYTTAINLCSSHDVSNVPQLLTNRAIAYIGLNCYPEARSDLNQAVMVDRCFTPAWTQLGYCHLYMGSCLTGLECYLEALESLVGDVVPRNLPKLLVAEYKRNKIDSLLPQFVHRIVQAMILTETRCYQEGEERDAIQDLVISAQKILSRLRSNASSDDMPYFAYVYDYNDGSFRSSAARSNRVEPNILTHEVSQDILASGGFETATVSIPTTASNPLDDALDNLRAGNNRGRRVIAIGGTRINPTELGAARGTSGGTRTNSGDNGATPATRNSDDVSSNPSSSSSFNEGDANARDPAAPNNVRNLLNNFGEMFQAELAREGPAGGATASAENPDQLRNTLRNMLPEGLGGMVTQVLGSLGEVVNGNGTQFAATNTRTNTNTGRTTNSNASSGANGTNNSQPGSGDVEMPDPDLD